MLFEYKVLLLSLTRFNFLNQSEVHLKNNKVMQVPQRISGAVKRHTNTFTLYL